MQGILYLLIASVRLILSVWYLLFIISAVLSWLPDIDNAFTDFVFSVTEPVLAPIRDLFDRLGVSSALPIDLSFLVVMILLSIVLNLFNKSERMFRKQNKEK